MVLFFPVLTHDVAAFVCSSEVLRAAVLSTHSLDAFLWTLFRWALRLVGIFPLEKVSAYFVARLYDKAFPSVFLAIVLE